MILSFELSMPNRGSWNGQWTGQGRAYIKTRFIGKTKEAIALGNELNGKSFFYSWDDGWTARVDVRKVTSAEAQKIRRMSAGFCGYDWMIDSIISQKEIVLPL